MNSVTRHILKNYYRRLTGPTLEDVLKQNPAALLAENLGPGLAVKEEGGCLKIVVHSTERRYMGMKRQTSVAERVLTLANLRDIQGQDGNWNFDAYMHGFYNGLELALAVIEDREPKYRDSPKRHGRPWLRDVSTPSRIKRFTQKFKRLFHCRLDVASMTLPDNYVHVNTIPQSRVEDFFDALPPRP